MSINIINGKEIASKLNQKITNKVKFIKEEFNIIPKLVVILIGEDPASSIYVSNKQKYAQNIGIESIKISMRDDISESQLVKKIYELNQDNSVHGILVQLPLPKHINPKNVIYAIDPKKDVDGFHVVNAGKLSVGQIYGEDKAIIPCTPLGAIYLLKTVKGDDLSGLKTLVIGNSNIVGSPLAKLLTLHHCTVTIANSKTKDLKAECLNANVIFSATGVSNLITADMVNQDSVIIDIGINRININGKTKLVGDVDFNNVSSKCHAITPVPGGVGPMTISFLLQNTINCCMNFVKKDS